MKTAVSTVTILAIIGASYLIWAPRSAQAWGASGHRLAARAAVLALPDDMPLFFTDSIDQLVYLNPEPDRWRDPAEAELDSALNQAYSVDHYLDLELVPEGALDSADRYEFARAVGDGTLPGFSSFRTLELFQRVRLEFRLWRQEDDAQIRGWIEQRIINDAGILGHYITDASNPLHTTIHFDGWTGDNPNGYETDRGIHTRFEAEYVNARISLDDMEPFMNSPVREWDNPRRAILDNLEASFAMVEPLYELDRDLRFGESTDSEAHHQFTAQRLAQGALALRDAWWTAWVSSAE
jgi:hypothetical protein